MEITGRRGQHTRTCLALLAVSTTLMAAVGACGFQVAGTQGSDQARRPAMVDTQLKKRGIRSRVVLEAMGRVPRHRFVSWVMRGLAYDDSPLPIGQGQTISQPYIV